MDNNTILFARNFLFRTFLVGILLTIFLFAITVALRDVWLPMATGLFKIGDEQVSQLVLDTFLNIRIVLLFFLLAPAIALHWMAKGKG